MGKRKFDILLLKNTLAVAIPAIAVFVVLLFMFLRYPVFEQIKCSEIGDVDNLNVHIMDIYESGAANVKYVARNLKYTGFEYLVDNKVKGGYYYSIINKKMMIFLINTKEPPMEIDSIELKGRIIKDNVSTDYIINQFALENNIEPSELKGYCSEYVISEPDYPYIHILLVYIIFITPIIICTFIVFHTLFVWACPTFHNQAKQLEEFGNISEVIKEINSELAMPDMVRRKNIYVTENYMVISYLSKTDVIKLDNIKYLSKNIVGKSGILNRGKVYYRLTMSNPEILFYELDFVREDVIDDIIEKIRKVPKQ